MIKKQSLIVLIFLCASFLGFGQISDLIISEYGEGSSNNKYLEIYNGTGTSVDLSDYEIWRISNGGRPWSNPTDVYPLTSTLLNGNIYVLAAPTADPTILAAADATDWVLAINGDDAIGLAKLGVLIDVIGVESFDPGTAWDVAGTTNATANHTLVRKSTVCSPNTDWTSSAGTTVTNSEWFVFPNDTWTDIGSHTESCSSTSPSIIVSTASLSGFTYLESNGPSGEQNFTVEGTNLTDDIIITPPTDWEISLTTGGAFAATNPITLTQAGGNVASTTVHTRLKTGLLNANSPFSGNITATSTLDAITENIAVDGTVTPSTADVVITEIMYNTPSFDDEWIEICNISGSTQDISNYIITFVGNTNNSPTPANLFTFPGSTTIADGTCITISLGSDGDGTFNDGDGTVAGGYCPFTPDFGIDALTNDTNHLLNTFVQHEIILYASDGTTVADMVTYLRSDGGNGNGSSLHVTDATMDNSSTGTNWQEVNYGGSASPATNSLTPSCAPSGSEINVEGNLGSFPDIAGDATNTPAGFNNTLFPGTPLLSSVTKSFRIQNLGLSDLTIGAISFSGAGAGDFSISTAPSSPVTAGNFTTFDIQFTPTVLGSRVAVVSIINNDADEDPYEFNIEGTGLCSASHSITSFAPTSGPVGTEVTIIGTGFSAGSTVSFNGGNTTVISQTATELVVEVPTDASTGIITVTESSCDTESSTSFTLTEYAGGCTLSNLIMTEIYDNTSGSLGYIEVYNGTGNTIDLTNYYIRRYGNSTDFADGVYTDYYFSPSVTSIANDTVLYGKISTNSDTASPDFDYLNVGGFAGINGEDIFHLYNGSTLLDVYIVTETMVGYTATRNVNTAGPNIVSNPSDWTETDPESITDLGLFPFALTNNPSVTNQPMDVDCNTQAEFSVQATAGEGGTLTYEWYFNDGVSSNWDSVDAGDFPLAAISGETSDTFTISTGFYNYLDYQFYCLVTEDAGCSSASNAGQIDIESTTWTSGGWSDGSPDTDTIAIIDFDYNTGSGGQQISFDACNLIVNLGSGLDIDDGTYVNIQNDVIIYGDIIVRPTGALVQVEDSGIFTLDPGGTAKVEKETAPANQWYEYTYWSSPVEGETVGNALADAESNRRFWFNAQNYRDSFKENGNSNTYNNGQDDVDDELTDGTGTDWILATDTDTMTPGVGYASTHNQVIFNSTPGFLPFQFKYTFEGPFNTGTVTVPIYRNDDEMADNNWNFLGNPYPSAIDADLFLAANTVDNSVEEFSPNGVTDGAIFFWSQDTSPSSGNTGNQNENFVQDDYAIINMSGQTAGGDGLEPTRHIPSGQGFFISYANVPEDADNVEISPTPKKIIQGAVTFTNNMRVTGNNNQFFRESNSTISGLDNKLWINLTSDNGVFNQLVVAYINNATNGYDGMAYDAPRNLSTELYSSIYTTIEGDNKKFAIQGKNTSDLTLDEIIPLGFDTSINVATIYTLSISTLEGDFFNSNAVFLKDNLMNTIHELSKSNYTFTSEVGEFRDRFEIVFTNASLSTNNAILEGIVVSIIELDSDNIMFKSTSNQTIKSVTIFDALGRLLYNLKGNSNSETYNLSGLSQATYIAKVELSNGIIVTKKAVKRK